MFATALCAKKEVYREPSLCLTWRSDPRRNQIGMGLTKSAYVNRWAGQLFLDLLLDRRQVGLRISERLAHRGGRRGQGSRACARSDERRDETAESLTQRL